MTERVAVPMRETLIVSMRCVIEAPRKSDFAEWAALREASRAHLEKWEPLWPGDAHTRRDYERRLRAWDRGWRDRRAYIFFIRRQSDRALLGGLSLTQVRGWPSLSGTLGYWLGERFEGEGYMREAVAALCDWSWSALGLSRIEAATLPGNARSQDVLRANGFKEEGLAKAYIEIAGVYEDHVLFGLVRPERCA
jgi:[ribosomal protein S5]-alanine N-acetyltransferase